MSKNLLIVFVILIAYSNIINAQVYEEWVRRYDGPAHSFDYLYDLEIDNFGNVYVAGASDGINSLYDCTTIKYNNNGDILWIQRYNGPGNSEDVIEEIILDQSGNIYVTGSSAGLGTSTDFVTIKYNSSGVQQWVQRYNGSTNAIDLAHSIAVDFAGNVYVTGSTSGSGSEDYDYATVKYNSSGVQQWVQKYNGPGNYTDISGSIGIDNSGNVYVTGWSVGNSNNIDYATIKYNSNGVQQWVQRFNGSGNGEDYGKELKVDNLGNVYVLGRSVGASTGIDITTVKYNSSGVQQWVKSYNAIGNEFDEAGNLTLDASGNIYVVGSSVGVNGNRDFATIKYNSSGVQQWVQRYNGTGNGDEFPSDIIVDTFGNVFITGSSEGIGSNFDYTTIKYNASGIQQWVQRYNGPGNGWDNSNAIGLDNFNNVFIAGYSNDTNENIDYLTIKYSQIQLEIMQPSSNIKWISGETNIIQWNGWTNVNIKCIYNIGTPIESIQTIVSNISVNQTQYSWLIPDTLLSYRSKIIIENASNPSQTIESGIFRIKPYLLTRVNPDSTYYDYRKDRDQWKFYNKEAQMFPSWWYQQFNYQGIDPFTGIQYPQWQGLFTFKNAKSKNFPDWISFVNTFTVNSCYWNTNLRIYKQSAILRWKAIKDTAWNGSCFGLAVSNGLVFKNKSEFQTKYPNFPTFVQPSLVDSSIQVRKVINELFTHQYGEPHVSYINDQLNKTPAQTLNEIKELLKNDNDPTRILSIFNNSGPGGHAILPYKLVKNIDPNIYSLYVYDNSIPVSNNPIVVNLNDGTWSTSDWPKWGGHKGFFLSDPLQTYLLNPSISIFNKQQSSFSTRENELQILNSKNPIIKIKDTNGNITGFQNDSILVGIPNSAPLISQNGKETPPYGYKLPMDNYILILNNSASDTVNTFLFTGNKIFEYERYGAINQTDKIYFDGGISVVNSDPQMKTVNLLNNQTETTQEKLFSIHSLQLQQNDSVKLENLGSNNFKLSTFTTFKNYKIELNYSSQTTLDRFESINISLPANSSHTFIPNWPNIQSSQLMILEDIGNNGSIDDTIRINNIITGFNGIAALPENYNLYQNFPNPFNPTTTIKYDIKENSFVSLKVYDLLGREITSLVNEMKLAGRYEVEFIAANLSSGIYYYQLKASDYIQTKKMMILK